MDYDVGDGSLVITQVTEHGPYSLKDLMNRITPENIHGETETGPGAGKEIW